LKTGAHALYEHWLFGLAALRISLDEPESNRIPSNEEGFMELNPMKRKTKSMVGVAEPSESAKLPAKKVLLRSKDLERRVSANPLYETTDQYRKVCKPMNIEDFLSA